MTSKQRAYLRGLAMNMESVFQIGKAGVTPEVVESIRDALEARELVKVNVIKNCEGDPYDIADMVSGRTGSHVVQVIGRKFVLYKESKKKKKDKIVLPD